MRKNNWRYRLRHHWLETVLLVIFVDVILWLVLVVEPVARPLLTNATPILSPTPVPTLWQGGGEFVGQQAFAQVKAQMAFGPRPTGSAALKRTMEYLISQLTDFGWSVEIQEFTYQETRGYNIIAKAGEGPVAIIGAHYDTRRRADNDPEPTNRDKPVPGANDGASGTAVLLEIARVLDKTKLQNEVWLTFFDAEDNGRLDGWEFIAGSTEMAQHLTVKPAMVVVLDMIGDANQQIYRERSSTPELVDRIWGIAQRLGYGDVFLSSPKWTMIDDHTPFLQQGIPAADLIDFDYPYWHTVADTADKVAPESLERVGRVMQALLEGR